MRLTEQQLRYFETFGFLQFPGLMADKIDRIIENFERVWVEHGGGGHGKEHDDKMAKALGGDKMRSMIYPFAGENEYLSALLDDARIAGIAASICGDDFNYRSSDGNLYVGDTMWHSDGYMVKKRLSIKMAFYLDPIARDAGCLRVIPGSHHVGDSFGDALESLLGMKDYWSRPEQSLEELWGVAGADVPAFALEVQPGDVVLFNHPIKHGSFGGGARRRMFTMQFEQRYKEEDLPELRRFIAGQAEFAAKAGIIWERAYGDAMIRTAGPSRMRHLEQHLANDGDLAELARKARQELGEPSRG